MATYYRQAQLDEDERHALQYATSGLALEDALKATRNHLKKLCKPARSACDTGTLTPEQATQARDGLTHRQALLTTLQEEHGVTELAEYIEAHNQAIRILDAIANSHNDNQRPNFAEFRTDARD